MKQYKKWSKFRGDVTGMSLPMFTLALLFFLSAMGVHFLFYLFFIDGIEVLSCYEITIEQILCFIPLTLIIAGVVCCFGLLLLLVI